ncbi:MAG: NAD+ synthase [Gammaproteobacteria bacterium]|nr:NAD+ synthase [Gammaproteobacteria bacterium]
MTDKNNTGLRIVMAQQDFMVGAIEANASKMLAACNEARDELAADVIVFPELALTGYPPEDLLLRPHFIGQVEAAVARLTDGITGITAVVGYPLQEEGVLYNVAGVIRDGGIAGLYRKQHLPNYGVFDEKRYFAAGDAPCIVPVRDVPLGITVCEDIWVQGPACQAAEAGAAVLININASPFHTGKRDEREQMLAQRARNSNLPIVYVNLVGGQDELVFDGGSFAVGPDGVVTQHAPACVEGLYPVDFRYDDRLLPVPADCAPVLSEEAAVYGALVLGVRDYVKKNGFGGAVLGLSGGIDSALTLAIAVDAIGAERVSVVMMPSRYTADMSSEDARAEAELLGVDYHVIPIEGPFSSFLGVLEEIFHGTEPDATEENIQARCRGIILMALSNKQGRILLTTGNKSEVSVGYATLYGDMAGGYAPIKDVPKLLVYRLSEYRNSLGRVIPQRVIERPPSAELAPDQVDADSLPPYEILDPILERYIEHDQSVEEIVSAGFEVAVVRRVAKLVDRNEYKRRQAPPGVRITQRAFGRDRRYPITSGYQNFQNTDSSSSPV